MKTKSRTERVIINTVYGFLFKISDTVFSFVLRTIFIKTLGITYLGINGLFTNILTVLSLMELGVGSAIVFSLYEPLAKKDNKKIAALMRLYKNIYTALGILIAVIGFGLTPFLSYILTMPAEISDIRQIYWLTIANTSITYFLSYRRTLLQADQQASINSKNQILFKITRLILLSIVLVCTKNFIMYLIMDMLNTLASNIHITYVVKKKYPYLEHIKSTKLEEKEKKNIVKYIKSGIYMKIGQTVVTSTDSILIAIFISVTQVGIYSNYNLVYTGLDTVIYLVFANLTASVGNYMVYKSAKEAEKLFQRVCLINYLVVNAVTVCLYCLYTPFVQLWLGEEYLLSGGTVSVIVLNFYLTAMLNGIGNFMAADGELTYFNRFRPIIEGVVNLVASIIFVKVCGWGITAIFLGTTVCFISGRVWMDPYVLYKYKFQESFVKYLKMFVSRSFLTLINIFACKSLSQGIFDLCEVNVFSWSLVGIICFMISNATVWLVYKKTDEFNYFLGLIKTILIGHKKKGE